VKFLNRKIKLEFRVLRKILNLNKNYFRVKNTEL